MSQLPNEAVSNPYRAPEAEIDRARDALQSLDPRAAALYASIFDFRRKKSWAAYLWLIFFGIVGAHQYYLDNWRKGMVFTGTFALTRVARYASDVPEALLLVGALLDLVLVALLLWDLFLTVRQVRRRNEQIRDVILADIHALQEARRAREASVE